MKFRGLTLAILAFCFTSAHATPVAYNFTASWWTETEGANAAVYHGTLAPSFFSPGDLISGTFFYDAEAPFVSGVNPVNYKGAITSLSASVAGHSISDPAGYGSISVTQDSIALVADPDVPTVVPPALRNISGFSLDGWQLGNLRLFWIDDPTVNGHLDITSSALPFALAPPGFAPSESRVALDFLSPLGDRRHISFFNNLTVSAVPEPSVVASFGFGLFFLFLVRVRSRKTFVCSPRSAFSQLSSS